MMVVIDLFFLGGWAYIFPDNRLGAGVEVVKSYVPVESYFGDLVDQDSDILLEPPPVDNAVDASVDRLTKPAEDIAIGQLLPSVDKEETLTQWRQYAVAFDSAAHSKPKVIIIIDDMGLHTKNDPKVLDLPAPLTLAYLPYAPNVKKKAAKARAAGHELMIHTPMEPMSKNQNPGDMALMDAMSPDEAEEQLETIFDSFDGYIGINNHMGSRLTQNAPIMRRVMEQLHQRGLVFVDSKTSAKSVAADMAKDTGIYYAQRDVFLDHEATDDFVAQALEKLEDIALRRGYAIAIGHPKDVTIRGLKDWIPTLEDKGIALAPVSAVLNAPQRHQRLAKQP